MEHETCGCDGNDLFEDATDAKCDDGSSLKEGEFGGGHEEGEATRKEQDQDAQENTLRFRENSETLGEGAKPLNWDGNYSQADEHDWRKEEDTAERIACRWITEEENLCEGPPEAREEGSGDDEDETESAEVDFSCDHHDDANGHSGDNKD